LPDEQARPHAPQLPLSLVRSTHTPPQLPLAQTQLPEPLHTPPLGDVHPPEVRGDALHATTPPEHTVVPVA